MIGDLYDCGKQTMQGVIQSQNHKFCRTREAKVESFKAHIFEFFRDRKLLKAQHCQMLTLDYLCYSNVVGGISSHKVLHRHLVSRERCLETIRLNEFEDNPMTKARGGGLTSGMHRTFSCHWLEHTDVKEKVMTIRKLSGVVTQGCTWTQAMSYLVAINRRRLL